MTFLKRNARLATLIGCATALLTGTIACNRTSLELPAPILQSTVDTTIGLGGQRQFLLHFLKTGYGGQDSLLLYVQNLGPTGYKNLDLILEFTVADKPRYGSYYYHHLVHLDTLAPAAKSSNLLLSADSSMLKAGTRINAGVVGYDGSRQPLAGDYSSLYTTFQRFDTPNVFTVKRYANTEGYILADGTAHFRIATIGNVPAYYTLDGTLIDSVYFSGTLRNDSIGTTQALLDTVAGGAHFNYDASLSALKFRLKLQPLLRAEDSSGRILFQLHKK